MRQSIIHRNHYIKLLFEYSGQGPEISVLKTDMDIILFGPFPCLSQFGITDIRRSNLISKGCQTDRLRSDPARTVK